MADTDKPQIRKELRLRYRLIELISNWEGFVNSTHLAKAFGIERQQATKDIKSYLLKHPANLAYNKSLKGYEPTKEFTPRYLENNSVDEYLRTLAESQDSTVAFQPVNIVEHLAMPTRNTDAVVLRKLMQAAREQRRVEVEYLTFNEHSPRTRVISPHSLVCTSLRWHVRAYCEKRKDFCDFVLSRFKSIVGKLDKTDVKYRRESDESWQNTFKVVIVPDPRLEDFQKRIIEKDYNMQDGKLILETRQALVFPYLIHALNLDLESIKAKPLAQQIIIENLDNVLALKF